MKNKLVLAIVSLLAILLAACSNNSPQQTTAPNSVLLHITNNTNAAIYGMEISWYQDGVLKGTQGGINADGSIIKKGESMVFELFQVDVDSTEDLLLEIALLTSPNSNTKVQLDSKTPIKLAGYGNYYYELVSDAGEIRLMQSTE
ncbi:hypothetical protein [Sporosarcina sp. UB5]|uniref:hypothetical protein n=1 Tax=Sporosarcina sp. UB5 TaxID=3047463 RepID=UPI003D79BC0E